MYHPIFNKKDTTNSHMRKYVLLQMLTGTNKTVTIRFFSTISTVYSLGDIHTRLIRVTCYMYIVYDYSRGRREKDQKGEVYGNLTGVCFSMRESRTLPFLNLQKRGYNPYTGTRVGSTKYSYIIHTPK